jgi:hypothetical protein
MTLQRLGVLGCAVQAAGEFGDHPDTAVARMRWALAMINMVYPAPSITPARDLRSLAFVSRSWRRELSCDHTAACTGGSDDELFPRIQVSGPASVTWSACRAGSTRPLGIPESRLAIRDDGIRGADPPRVRADRAQRRHRGGRRHARSDQPGSDTTLLIEVLVWLGHEASGPTLVGRSGTRAGVTRPDC